MHLAWYTCSETIYRCSSKLQNADYRLDYEHTTIQACIYKFEIHPSTKKTNTTTRFLGSFDKLSMLGLCGFEVCNVIQS